MDEDGQAQPQRRQTSVLPRPDRSPGHLSRAPQPLWLDRAGSWCWREGTVRHCRDRPALGSVYGGKHVTRAEARNGEDGQRASLRAETIRVERPKIFGSISNDLTF